MKTILSICFSLLFTCMYAQKELWGLTNNGGSVNGYGAIFKTDVTGENAEITHAFDNTHGMKPYGRLFLASNGKLYGTASEGGIVQPNPSNTGGLLFEYDLIFNRFNVVTYFGSEELSTMLNPRSGVIEVNGSIIGTASGIGIYNHDIAEQNTDISALVTVAYTGSNAFTNKITGELMRASDGMIYGTTQYYSACPTLTPLLGCIVRFNPVNNSFNYIYPFNCTYYDGASPTGSLVEGTPGKLYGTTQHGGDYGYVNGSIGDGTLFEYDIATNTYTKKFSFNRDTTGAFPGPLTPGANNKLYGVLGSHGNDPDDPDPNNEVKGSIYEYDLVTQTVTVLYYFSDAAPNIFLQGHTPTGSLLKTSDGIFCGINSNGVFKFDPVTETVTLPEPSTLENFYPHTSGDLIEICRKPSYAYFENDSFTVCTETDFTFNVQNNNAASYSWKKNGVLVPAQATGILTLNDLTVNDSGDYTCEMVNECGTTVTMPLHLVVEPCMGLYDAVGLKNDIKLYPNPAKDILNIQLPENPGFIVSQTTIINSLGQIVINDVNGQTIDVSNLSTGMYLVKMKTSKGDWFGKFVKY